MAGSLTQTLDLYLDRSLSDQGAEAERSIITVTFSAALTVAVVVAAMQVADAMGYLLWSSVIMGGLSLALALAVLVADRRREPAVDALILSGLASGSPPHDVQRDVRHAILTAVIANRSVLGRLRGLVWGQLLAAAASWTLTAVWFVQRAAS